MKRWMGLLVYLFFAAVVMCPPSSAAEASAMVIGRIYHIEGDLLRYVPTEKDWVAVVKDVPFGTEDTFFSGSRGMSELIVPNGTWIRIGESTQIQFITLDTDLSEIDVASGVSRFYNKGSDTVIKATSPFGYVLAYPGTVFDFYVGDNSVEVVAVRGTVSFIHSATDAKYDVAAGSPSILADQQQVSLGEGLVDPGWDRWNKVRENFWAAKARVKGRSVEYLPPSLRDESYALDENGRWESVPYEGSERWFWRPTTVVASWSPFTVGRWTDWYGDQTWIPAEPFGYVTHHYGNWVYVRNYWYWAPPVVSVRVGLPLLDVGFYWYPGRVSWIHTGIYVGWVPLTPRETYYSYRHWGGPHAVVVNNVNIAQINVNVRNYAYVNRAIVVDRNNFYGVNNYTKVRVTNITRTTIINNYHAAPVVSNMVINNYTTIKQRYNYTNVEVNEKPHNTVINRIQQNVTMIHEDKKEKASVLQERVRSISEGKVNREVRIEEPKITNYIVPAGEVNRPKSEIKLQQRKINSPGVAAKPEKQPEQSAVRPERVTPAKPSKQEKPGQPAGPERVSPAKPAQPGQPAARPDRVAPARPSRQEKPGQPVERDTEKFRDRKPAERGVEATKEGKPQEKVTPGKPKETIKPPEKGAVEKPKEVKPIEKVLEKSREVKPSEKAIEKQKVKPPEKDLEKPKDQRTLEKQIEKPREQRPVQKQIEKPKEPRPSDKEVEKRRERKDPEEEGEKPKK